MTLQCNIDARGKRMRLVMGLILILAAIAIAGLWAIPAGSLGGWIVAAALLLSGAFCLYEARHSWCALRAMGIKTPM